MTRAIFLFLFCPLLVLGQQPVAPTIQHKALEPWMIGQVKHVSQFIERFDYQKLPDGSAFTDSTRALYPREQYIRALFNQEDPRLSPSKTKASSYALLMDTFLEPFRQKEPFLIGQQPAITAIAPCLVQVLDKTDTLFFSLRKHYRSDSASYWQVEGLKLPTLLLKMKTGASPKDSITRHDLEPNAHEVTFLPLLRYMVDHHSILPMVADSLQSQKEVLRLETLLKEKKIVLTVMLPPTLWIETSFGWQIQLHEFIRETENSGWLITNLHRK